MKKERILIILLCLLVLLLGGYIVYDKVLSNKDLEKESTTTDNNIVNEENSLEENKDNNDDSTSNISIDRDEIVNKLKDSLTNEEWVKNNLYSDKNCFNKEVTSDNQNLTFAVLSDNSNNPIIIVNNYTIDDFINTCYKVYYDDGNIVVKNVTGNIEHPAHVFFKVDKGQGLVIYTYGHMGSYTFKAYDVKNNEITLFDEYSSSTYGDYEYRGDKTYDLSDISIELNGNNINNYIK